MFYWVAMALAAVAVGMIIGVLATYLAQFVELRRYLTRYLRVEGEDAMHGQLVQVREIWEDRTLSTWVTGLGYWAAMKRTD